jgi:7-cyano-7-deazaguanine synthase
MRAIILVSGGIDSTVLLATAIDQGRQCFALTFDYGQRHRAELDAAKEIARYYEVSHRMIRIDPLAFDQSSLVGEMAMVKGRSLDQITGGAKTDIPNTYVPARNTLFLAYAMAQAEIFGAGEIYLGANANDTGYPDCSPEYLSCFNKVLQLATRQALHGHAPRLCTPLLSLDKPGVIALGHQLNAPLQLTISCYDPQGSPRHVMPYSCDAQGREIQAGRRAHSQACSLSEKASEGDCVPPRAGTPASHVEDYPQPQRVHCGSCDACVLRQAGFISAGLSDPTTYCGPVEVHC